MPDSDADRPLIDYAKHRREWEERRQELRAAKQPARFTVRATVELLHDFLKEGRVRSHTFRSDEARPGGEDTAANPLGYFVAAVGF